MIYNYLVILDTAPHRTTNSSHAHHNPLTNRPLSTQHHIYRSILPNYLTDPVATQLRVEFVEFVALSLELGQSRLRRRHFSLGIAKLLSQVKILAQQIRHLGGEEEERMEREGEREERERGRERRGRER